MKHENLIYGISTVIILVCVTMKILHLPGAEIADLIYKIVFLGMFFFISFQNTQLKKRIKELEG